MPKLRQTDQQRRDAYIAGAVARGTAESGLKWDRAVAECLGIGGPAFCKHKANSFQGMQLGMFSKMARRLGLTGEEVCKIIGVPYREAAPDQLND